MNTVTINQQRHSANPSANHQMTFGRILAGFWLCITSTVGLFTLLPWLTVVAFGAVMFDAGPNSELAGMVKWVVLFPLLPLSSVTLSWFLFMRRHECAASLAACTCFIPVIWIAQYC